MMSGMKKSKYGNMYQETKPNQEAPLREKHLS